MAKRNRLIGAIFAAILGGLLVTDIVLQHTVAAQNGGGTVRAPRFEVDPFWPKPLPNHWLLGSTIGVWVDERDHVWIIHRSSATLNNNERGAELNPATGECCKGAPPVLEFDAEGNLVQSWGGPGQGYEWPQSNHGIFVDHKGNVWIGGNGAGDSHILKFTRNGKFIAQYGKAGVHKGPVDAEGLSTYAGDSNDQQNFGRVAKIFVDPRDNEAYIADGYLNKRVAVLDADTGKMKRYWGAYGNKPDDTNLGPYNPDAPPAQQFRNPVHCADVSNDGFVYVCDRVNTRLQVFTKEGKFVKENWYATTEPCRRIRVGRRLLEGSKAEVHFHGRRSQPACPRHPAATRSRSSPHSATAAGTRDSSSACTASRSTRRATCIRPRRMRASACRSSYTRAKATCLDRRASPGRGPSSGFITRVRTGLHGPSA